MWYIKQGYENKITRYHMSPVLTQLQMEAWSAITYRMC